MTRREAELSMVGVSSVNPGLLKDSSCLRISGLRGRLDVLGVSVCGVTGASASLVAALGVVR